MLICVFVHSRFIENPQIWFWEIKPSFLRWLCHNSFLKLWALYYKILLEQYIKSGRRVLRFVSLNHSKSWCVLTCFLILHFPHSTLHLTIRDFLLPRSESLKGCFKWYSCQNHNDNIVHKHRRLSSWQTHHRLPHIPLASAPRGATGFSTLPGTTAMARLENVDMLSGGTWCECSRLVIMGSSTNP
jgi:hypothetical protein